MYVCMISVAVIPCECLYCEGSKVPGRHFEQLPNLNHS